MCNIMLMVYGTLQNDFGNSRFCQSCLSVEAATVCGRIYQLPAGYPVLLVPAENILAEGTRSPSKDTQTQFDVNFGHVDWRMPGGWYEVYGELVTFGDPERELPPIDRLESVPFYYLRVLVPVRRATGDIIAAWVYIMNKVPPGAKLITSGRWPE